MILTKKLYAGEGGVKTLVLIFAVLSVKATLTVDAALKKSYQCFLVRLTFHRHLFLSFCCWGESIVDGE